MTHNGNGRQHDEPPRNDEAERGLLASLIALPSAIDHADVVARVPGDFFNPQYAVLFRHLNGLHLEGRLPECLPTRLVASGEVEAAGGSELLRELFGLAAQISGSDAAYYAGKVGEASEQRKLWLLHKELGQQIKDRLPAEDIRGFLSASIEANDYQPSGKIPFITSEALSQTSFDVPYIIDGVLAEGQPAVIGGPSKAMKTGAFVDAMVSIQTGGHFFGYFPVIRAKRCWLISGESGQNVIAETAARVCTEAGRDLAKIGAIWGFRLPRLSSAADVRELGRIIKGEGIGVLGIDPLYLSLDTDGNESSMFGMGSRLRPVAEVCCDNGCTPILAHHFRQTIRDFDPPTLQDLSHAGVEQFARQWILLKRREKYQAGTGEHRLHLVTGGSAGHGGAFHLDINEGTRATPGGRFWQVKVTPLTEAMRNEQEQRAAAAAEREQARRVEHRQKIIAALRTFPKGETRKALRTATGLNDANFTAAITELLHEGVVELCEVKKHTTTHDGYRLVSPQKTLCRDMAGQGES